MEERKTVGQKALDLVGMLLRGLGVAVGWFLGEVEITLRLFSVTPPMFFELALAIIFLGVYLFPSGETMAFIDRIGTGLAMPFVLGLIYAVLNMIAVMRSLERGWQWRWSLFKASFFPAGLDYLIFANRTVHRFIGWGDPANALRFCVWLVWLVVIVNAIFVQAEAKLKR